MAARVTDGDAAVSDAVEPSAVPTDGLRVCVVGSGFRFTSGISYYTCRVATALAERHRVSVLLMRRLVPRRMYPGRDRVGERLHKIGYPDDVAVFDGVDWFWGLSILRAIRFLRRERPDVVVLQWWTGAVLHSYLLLTLVAHRMGARVVIEFHEIQDTGEMALPGARAYMGLLGQAIVSRAHGYLVHSAFDREAVANKFAVGSKPLLMLPHGPFDHHVSGYEITESAARVIRTLSPDRTTVLFFGTIRPYKGLETLVEAFDSLDDESAARLQLLVVGETWSDWRRPLELIAASARRDRIALVNRYVRDDEVSAFFAAADVVALPYSRSSASGPLHIAMSYGLPVIVSEVGGLRDGAAGYEGVTWIRPDDVDALRHALVAATTPTGEVFVDPRSWAASVDVFEALFALVGSASRR